MYIYLQDVEDGKITSLQVWNDRALYFEDNLERGDRIEIRNFRTENLSAWERVETKMFKIALLKHMA